MVNYKNIEFKFPLYLSEKKEKKGRFIFEGFAAANDFDLQNDIISDKALRKSVENFKKKGKFCLNHTEEVIGKILDCHFRKGKIWVKTEITKKRIIEKVKSGELNCLSIKGQINYQEKVELLPDLRLTLIKDLHLEEVSLVPKGANPEAKAIRWYVSKAIEMAETTMTKKIKKDSEEVEDIKKDEPEESEEKEEEKEEEAESKEDEVEENEGVEESDKDDKDDEEDEDEDKDEKEEEKEETEKEDEETEEEEKEEEEKDEKEEEEKKEEGTEKAVWTKAYINDLPNSSFAYIEAGGKNDKEGKTMPRSLRHLPYKEGGGKVDLPHLRNAIARAPHVKDKNGKSLSEATVSGIQTKLQKLLGGAKKDLPVTYREPKKDLSEKKEAKEEKIVYQVMNSADIKLEEKKDLSEFKKELLRVGTWKHDASEKGVLNVTKEMLKTIIRNFKDKVLDNVFVPLGHPKNDDPSKNTGEVVNLELSKNKDKLMATVDIKDKKVVEKIGKGLIKGISASFAEDYMKKDTGEKVGPTLFHAALVLEPFIKGMGEFAPVPLSEEMKDSTIIPIFNMEMAEKMKEIEKGLSANETSEETEEETSEEETSEKEETKSPKVGEKAEEGEDEETETEETETEEKTEEETEESKDKKGVDLSEGERIFDTLLMQGRVTPVEKELLLPLFESETPVELSDGKKVNIRKTMIRFLKSRKPIFSLTEDGVIEGDKKEKDEKIPDEVKEEMDKMGFSEDIQNDAFKEFKKIKEKKKEEETTPF